MDNTITVLLENSNSFVDWIKLLTPVLAIVIIGIWTIRNSTQNNRDTLREMQNQHEDNLEQEREHRIRSVRPIMTSFLTCDFVGKKKYKYEYLLLNNGLGPAIIAELVYYYKDLKSHSLKIIIEEVDPFKSLSVKKETNFSVIINTAIKANESRVLFSLTIDEKESDGFASILFPFLNEVKVGFDYKDIYDNPNRYEDVIMSDYS